MSDDRSRRVAIAALLVLVATSAPATVVLGSAHPESAPHGENAKGPGGDQIPAAEERDHWSAPGDSDERGAEIGNGPGTTGESGASERTTGRAGDGNAHPGRARGGSDDRATRPEHAGHGTGGENVELENESTATGDRAGDEKTRPDHARGTGADGAGRSDPPGRAADRPGADGHPADRATPAAGEGKSPRSDGGHPSSAAAERRAASASKGPDAAPGRARAVGHRNRDESDDSAGDNSSAESDGSAGAGDNSSAESDDGSGSTLDSDRASSGTASTAGTAANERTASTASTAAEDASNRSGDSDDPARDAPGPDDAPFGPAGSAVLVAGAATTASSRSVETASSSPVTFWMQVRSLAETARVWLASLSRAVSVGWYSRHADRDALDHEARERLYDIVAREPGVNVATLVERSDLARSTARYHLRVLEREGVLESANIRGKRRYFRAADAEDDVAWHAAVRDETTAAVIEAIDRHEPASGSTLAAELDRDASTISHHLDRLEEAGAIERERDGRAVVNRLTAAAREALIAPSNAENADRGRGPAD